MASQPDPFLPFVQVAAVNTKAVSPLTQYICDVLKMRMGTMTKDEIRTNWTKGKYKGVCPKRAKFEMEWM